MVTYAYVLLPWDADVFSDSNIYPTLSTCTLMGHSTTTPINNKIAYTNNILQHNSIIDERSSSVTYYSIISYFSNTIL